MGILIHTGAGGVTVCVVGFLEERIKSLGGGEVRRHLINKGKCSLQAANPSARKVRDMAILGSTVLPIVLPPNDNAKNISVRVVQGLPYAFILEASFFRLNRSVISPDWVKVRASNPRRSRRGCHSRFAAPLARARTHHIARYRRPLTI